MCRTFCVNKHHHHFVCLFRVYRPTREFFTNMRCHHCRWRAANLDSRSALMAIEQWGFFNVPHILRHGPTLYNGYLRGPVLLPSVWQWSCHYLFLRLRSVATGDRDPIFSMRRERSISTPMRRSIIIIIVAIKTY